MSSSSAALIHGSPSTPPQSQQQQQHSHQPPPPPQFRVLYMTEEMVVVDKPHGVPMDGAHHPSTVEKWIQGQMQSDVEDAAREDAAALIINKKEGAKCGDDTIGVEDEVVVPTPSSSICVDNTNHYSHNNAVVVIGEEDGGGGIGAQRMPRGYFTTPLPQGNRHTSSRGNAGPSVKQLKFVHQLDAPTSGLLCLAFSRDVAARLGHCFQMRKSVKVYSAVLFGWVGEEDVTGGKTTQTSYNPPPPLASSTPTPSPPSNSSSPYVFEGIPTPLNDYLASTPHFPPNTSDANTTTLLEDYGSRMPLLKPLSPFAALYEEESTTPTSSGNNNNYNNSSNINTDDVTPPSSSLSVSPAHHQIHIDAPIGNDPTDGSTLMTIGGANPRDASSLLQVVKRGYVTLPPSLCNGNRKDDTVGTGENATGGGGGGTVVKATHVLLRLYTGRRHQLRLHCRHIGHPIVGDASYVSEIPQNAKIDANNDILEDMSHPLPPVLTERMYLHAWRLAFFDSFEVGEHGKRERVEAGKKRRRESLGINASGGNGDVGGAAEVTGVSTGPDPFAHLVVSNSPQ